uniref:Carbohydrate sulfotransferase n=1 Tax=Timema poppense TaxID=170557 RepID=A0A7R9H276_TIMPO|nr:unnamed protein product [Timema poppensis]
MIGVLKRVLMLILLLFLFHTTHLVMNHQGKKEQTLNRTSGTVGTMNKNVPNNPQKLRRDRVSRVCARMRGPQPDIVRRHFLMDRAHKLLYCWIHKVASTSWTAVFSSLANHTHVRQYYREIAVLAPKHITEITNTSSSVHYFKFLLVRHPFVRLVSAYRDRLEDNSRFTSQAWVYAPQILSFTRPGQDHWQRMATIFRDHRLMVVPTFEEFIRWLLRTPPGRYDAHWNRYYDQCAPCSIRYDAILHLDGNETEELDYLLSRTEMKEPIVLQESFGGPTTFQVTCDYLGQLSRQQIHSLYHTYKVDFLMFGYSSDEYMSCGKDAQLLS